MWKSCVSIWEERNLEQDNRLIFELMTGSFYDIFICEGSKKFRFNERRKKLCILHIVHIVEQN